MDILFALDLFGTFIFALTGAIKGVHLKLDFLGVIVFACTVGVGGGIIRDMMIGRIPVAALSTETYLLICIVTGVAVFFVSKHVERFPNIILFCDAIGLGVFTVIGCQKGLDAGLSFIGVILTGVFTSCGGGVIRDLLAREIPSILTSDFYATASLIGGICFYVLRASDAPYFWSFVIVTCLVTLIRLAAAKFKVHLPKAH